jgi:hypothetical protein
MKKQLIEKITRELLAEARRYVAKVLTAEPDVRTTAKANGADLAFKIEFKVRPGFSQLPTDDDILDEVGNAIKNTPQVGITSKYSNGNYYYILSPDQSDKKRMFLYNVYIFRKNKVWENYPDWIDRTSDSTSTDNTTTSTDNVVVGKKNKPKNLPDITVKSSMGSMYRIGQSILLNADSWKSSSKNNIKTYKPLPAVEFINKVVNVTVDMPKLDEPTKTPADIDSTTAEPLAPTSNVTKDIETKTSAAVKSIVATNNTLKDLVDKEKTLKTVPTKSEVLPNIPIGKIVTLRTDVPTFVYKSDGNFEPTTTKLNPQGFPTESVTVVKYDKTNNYALIKLSNSVDKLPRNTYGVKFKNPGKQITINTADLSREYTAPASANVFTYITTKNNITKIKVPSKSAEIWVPTSELKIDRPNVWIRKRDIK